MIPYTSYGEILSVRVLTPEAVEFAGLCHLLFPAAGIPHPSSLVQRAGFFARDVVHRPAPHSIFEAVDEGVNLFVSL